MSVQSKIDWDSVNDMTLTNLASLADGNMWQSGQITDADPCHQFLRISYEIVFNATPIAGDSIRFYIVTNDDAASDSIWDGAVGNTIGQITTAASKAAVKAATAPVWEHFWQNNHGTTFKGHFDLWNVGTKWQLIVEANGEAFSASGHRIRYRYGSPAAVTA